MHTTLETLLETTKFLFANIQITDLIDIVIVAFLIYKCITFMYDSRAQFLIKGIAIVAAAYFASLMLNLNMLRYIVDLIIRNGALAMIVIFTPELRQGLERVGRSRLSVFSIFGRSQGDAWRTETTNTITSVVESLRQLQEQKMGALVVFEREIRLTDIIRTGTKVDARPGVQIIANIFYDKAPLHDGAVIIRDNRVYAAGCILPLSQNSALPVSLGTRHRAALGMSENSDAVVAVLSEETGNFSVAHNHSLETFKTVAELSGELVRILLPDKDESVILSKGQKNISKSRKNRGKSSSKEAD